MNILTYKGYSTKADYDVRDRIFVGRLLGIRDIVGFHADSFTEFEDVFKESVEDYLDYYRERGEPPQQPASGKMMLRVPPETHAAALTAAKLAGKSLNQWAAEVLKRAAG